jgi:hypothetical protein
MIDRRTFLKAGTMAVAGSALAERQDWHPAGSIERITIQSKAPRTSKVRLGESEMATGLRALGIAKEVAIVGELQAGEGQAHCLLTIEPGKFKGSEDYEISASGQKVTLSAAGEQALLYAVFHFLEKQGTVFGIDGATEPIDHRSALHLPEPGQPWTASPRFAVRGLLPWPDFWNSISVYNDEDFKAYFAAMLRMRFNMFGMHVYTQNEPGPMAESYLSFDFAGSGHRAALEDTTVTSWGYLPQRTSTFKMGAAEFFDNETFGGDATRCGANNWDIARRTTSMMRAAFDFARELGIRTGIGFEPYQNPAEIVRALPPEALSHPGGFVESNTARDLLERRLADLLERYPMVDYVWLWQDEDANWESRTKNIPLSTTPFVQAHDFLKRHAPDKQLVLAGWGGVTRHFESLHQKLPEDIVFSALSDTLGWDPVNHGFGQLGSRERWSIPWIEDDPSMWFPQFRASRFQTDMQRAKNFGCQGVLGLHWRHRVIDPTATYLARACWDGTLTAQAHYRNFSAAQASGPRIDALAALFDECDEQHAISSTFLGTYDKFGFANRIELAGDYSEAFNYENNEPELAILPKQREISQRFRQLASQAASPLEQNRVGYFAGFVGFMVPYCDAYEIAHKLNTLLQRAVKLRAAGKHEEARTQVLSQGVPLWLRMAPLVREVMLQYQAVVATRNDQGQLASMQNKFVRISLERLRLSIKEFVGELPTEMDQAYTTATSPESANRARVFIPTRPSLLKPGESLRIFIVAPGHPEVCEVKLLTRCQGTQEWQASVATHTGRSVYAATLGPFTAADRTVEYYVTVTGQSPSLSAPPQAPVNVYTLNVLA